MEGGFKVGKNKFRKIKFKRNQRKSAKLRFKESKFRKEKNKRKAKFKRIEEVKKSLRHYFFTVIVNVRMKPVYLNPTKKSTNKQFCKTIPYYGTKMDGRTNFKRPTSYTTIVILFSKSRKYTHPFKVNIGH